MKRNTRKMTTGLAIIGTGIAGCAAAIFARDRGLEVAQFGHSGALAYTTGYLDLFGVAEGAALTDPWAGLDDLRRAEPDHPLARVSQDDTRAAMTRFIAAITEMGVAYTPAGAENMNALLPYGVAKPTFSVPETMRPGIEALQSSAKTLIVDFDALQGFSGKEFQINFAEVWPALSTIRVAFPGLEGQRVFPEVMARSLETAGARAALADLIRPHLNGVDYVGLPAILGVHAPDKVRADMEARLGVKLFEIPTIPPAVPGIRLRELFERALPQRGVQLDPQLKVARVSLEDGKVRLFLSGVMEDLEVEAEAALLATGRFISGGLSSDREQVFENLIGLPVRAPESRDDWFRQDYLDPRGHALNRAGVETDSALRPLGEGGAPVHERLFAAGAILAGQDWVRQRCGASVAIATAWAAVEKAAEVITAR